MATPANDTVHHIQPALVLEAEKPSADTRYIDLALLGIETPRGWSNRPQDLGLDFHFVPGESVHGVLEYHGFWNIRPVIMDYGDVYIIQAERNGRRRFFTWNYLCDWLAMVKGDLGVTEVVRIVGIDINNLVVEYVPYPEY
ncbi:hypothetical protein Q9L58_007822 [Maublancomyces gigas]|uniref:Uncharacterized protein n=1 Tax=Discina gigas TaxID=1032678 RepID=A0ABR3GBF3_9PEZI